MTGRRERILFVELWRLGDCVAATAGLRALRVARPDAEIAVLAHPTHGDPLFRSKSADVRLRFDAFWTRGQLPRDKYLPWTIDYGALWRGARAIRAFRPDHVLLFRGDIREQTFFRALGARGVVDLKGPLPILPGIRTHDRPESVPRWREYVYHVQQWSGTSAAAEPAIEGVARPTATTSYVLVHPGASWRYKQWGADNVAQILRWLDAQRCAAKVVAGPHDRVFIDAVAAAYGAPLTVEYPSLDELYSLVAGARVVLCNNSAALHIAEALGTPCVALTGPSDRARWGTYRAHSRTLIRSEDLACHPCGEKRCVFPDAPCIDRIDVAEVIETLEDLGVGRAAPTSAGAGVAGRVARWT
jgi:ADP-heptose:LPS heptosyltransferase